jgi:hypothetical protein
VASNEQNLLPFSTPQSYALLGAESKATEAAGNKERLAVCRYIEWRRTVFGAISASSILLVFFVNDSEYSKSARK